VVNRQLIEDLIEEGIWSKELKNKIIEHGGSIQKIDTIPQHIKDLYKTVWEISQEVLIQMAADRGAFICQSQSFNCYFASPDFEKLSTFHFSGWKKGLKTGMYYLRRENVQDAVQFTIETESVVGEKKKKSEEEMIKTTVVADSKSSFRLQLQNIKNSYNTMEIHVIASSKEETGLNDNNNVYSAQVQTTQTTKPKRKKNQIIADDNIPMCKRDNPDCENCSG
jgi:ribonucleotide reductase alpha subunit